MVFHWSLSDSKSPQVSRTLLSILADLNNVVVWMVSTRPLISKPSSPFNNPSVTVPKAPIIIGINIAFMFHSFFQFPSRSTLADDLRLEFVWQQVSSVSRTLLSILADLDNAVVWMVSTRPLISMSLLLLLLLFTLLEFFTSA